MQTAEQVIAGQKAHIEFVLALAAKAFDGVEKATELNVQAAKALLSEAADHARAVLAAKDAQELLTLQSGLLQPAAAKALAYSRHAFNIATETGTELGEIVEAQRVELLQTFLAAVDTALKSAPGGSGNVVALVKSNVVAANEAFEGVQKAAKQAVEVAESNFNVLTTNAVNAAQQPAA